MKLEFHVHLSHLEFDGVYPIYWIKENKHAKKIQDTYMHAYGLKDPSKIQFGLNTNKYNKA
jgi:hypothetical protein